MRKSLMLCAWIIVVGAGCSWRKDHLIRDFGASYTTAFNIQRERSTAPAQALTGLDPQEAAITSDNYRAGLAPKGGQAKAEPMILVTPGTRERSAPLAPSVPPKE